MLILNYSQTPILASVSTFFSCVACPIPVCASYTGIVLKSLDIKLVQGLSSLIKGKDFMWPRGNILPETAQFGRLAELKTQRTFLLQNT